MHPTPMTTLAAAVALALGLVLLWVGLEAWLGRRAWARSLALHKGARQAARGPFGLFIVPGIGFFCLAAGFIVPSPFSVPIVGIGAGLAAIVATLGDVVVIGPRSAAALAPEWARASILGAPEPPPLPPDATADQWSRALERRLAEQTASQVLVCASPLGQVVVTGAHDDFTVAVLGAGSWRSDDWWRAEGFAKFGSYEGWRADNLTASAAAPLATAALRHTGARWNQIKLSACVGRLQLHRGDARELRTLMAGAPAVETADLERALA